MHNFFGYLIILPVGTQWDFGFFRFFGVFGVHTPVLDPPGGPHWGVIQGGLGIQGGAGSVITPVWPIHRPPDRVSGIQKTDHQWRPTVQSDSFAGPSAGMMITQACSAQQVIAVSVVTGLRPGDDDDKMTPRRSVATTFRGRPLTSCRRQDLSRLERQLWPAPQAKPAD